MTKPFEFRHGTFLVSTDPVLLDLDFSHREIATSYWAAGIPRELFEAGVRNSLCFGLYQTEGGARRQVGFARFITDHATFGYLCDVVITASERGHGLGKVLIAAVTAHPLMPQLRRIMLATKDAHGLYEQFGWSGLDADGAKRLMQITRPGIYSQTGAPNPPAVTN